MKVLLTHSKAKLLGLEPKLLELGLEVSHQPLIDTAMVLGSHIYQQAQKIKNYPWLFFTSSKAVEFWHQIKMPFNSHIAVVGKATAKAVLKHTKEPQIIAQPANAKGLLSNFLSHPDKKGPVGIIKGNLSLDILEQGLKANNISYNSITGYVTKTNKISSKSADIVVLASPSAAKALSAKLAKAKLVAIGSSTAQAINDRGWQCQVAASPEVNSILNSIKGLL